MKKELFTDHPAAKTYSLKGKLLILALVYSAFMTSCKRNEVEIPSDILKPEQMKNLLIDIHLIEAQRSNQSILFDSLGAGDYYKKAYEKHNLNGDEFKRNMEFYSRNPKYIIETYKEVIDSLDRWEKSLY